MCLSCTTIFAQDSAYVYTQLLDASQGQCYMELKQAHCSDLQTADMLWIYGDGNFDILHSCNLSSTHNYRCNPVHDPTLFSTSIYSPTKPPQISSKQIRGYKQGQLVDSFVPTGQQVEHTGWVKQGHYGAVRIFPAQLQP